MRHPTLIVFWLLLALSGTAPLRAQDEGAETGLERVQRDQARVALRLDSLRQKMERLAGRYEDEGRERNARLLREAIRRFDEDRLLDVGRQLERDLRRGLLSSVEQQDSLVEALERVYAALRDRRDAEELDTRAELAREGVVELGYLARNQRDLLARTRAATDRPADLLREALRVARRLGAALAGVAQAAASQQEPSQPAGEAELAEELARAERDLARAAAPSAPEQAALEAALDVLEEQLERAGPQAGGELGQAAREARAEARREAAQASAAMARARENLQRAGEGQAGEPAASQPGATPEQAQPAEQEAARAEMEAAAEALDRVGEALRRSERSLAAARNRARAGARVSAMDAEQRGQELLEQVRRLEAVQPEQGPELLDRTRALLEELARLARAARDQDAAGTQAGQQGAQASLDELLRMLRQRAQGADDTPRPEPDEATLAGLADRQAELQRQTRELMQRLEEIPDEAFGESMSRAGSAMQRAEEALRQGDLGAAGEREEEAAEQLEQAQQELQGERDRYEQLRQEEVLFRLGEMVTSLRDRQQAVNAETLEVDQQREAERLGRRLRRAVSRMAGTERDLAGEAHSLGEALQQDGAVTFVFALDRVEQDMTRAGELLGDERTGYLVRAVQDDVLRRLEDLLIVLDEELERRREALARADEEDEDPPGGAGQGGGPPPLVPPVAELLLIQRMEHMALGRLEQFERANPGIHDEQAYGDMERELLQRWSLEHAEVTELFDSILQALQGGVHGSVSPHDLQPVEPEPLDGPEEDA